jgi:hypothetical protein
VVFEDDGRTTWPIHQIGVPRCAAQRSCLSTQGVDTDELLSGAHDDACADAKRYRVPTNAGVPQCAVDASALDDTQASRHPLG